ncbi:LEAF RUST 10 DISEASE-RESISTANCE LOCUS RECEPTOR-LIKE PROTEIN KINASE-like 2.1 [Quillaja saponaria]|uniref:non-specific serine/threonine protein kinase n=1 Tax=Quillaja saponaria TaxID=32244 RepID=A0AAD7M652_QUISA|nr:LEAF RUST 10 DISEASE-RESISTANCE LOCUS RECEPTOR-LIKE PROTEIN KINASE-like 2.1 [Quillaja saponaria]
MSKPPCFLFALSPSFFFFFFFMKSYAYNISNTSSTVCPYYDCGNGLTIHYPFWLVGNTTAGQYCGYRDFGLNCSSDGKPIITLPSDSYYVTDINYNDNTLTLLDIDVKGKTCPRARHNLTIGSLPLKYNPLSLNLSFYFNCSSYPSSSLVPFIECLRFGAMRSFVFAVGNETDDFNWSVYCQEKVLVTVMEEEIMNGGGLISGFGGAMNKGFVLDWGTARSCAECETSNGFCGYNNTNYKFLCFCKDGRIGENNCKEKSWSFKTKVIVGVFASFGSVVIISMILFIYFRRVPINLGYKKKCLLSITIIRIIIIKIH